MVGFIVPSQRACRIQRGYQSKTKRYRPSRQRREHDNGARRARKKTHRLASAEAKDVVGWSEAVRMTCPPATELRPVGLGSWPKTPAKRSDSKLRGLPGAVGLTCNLTQGIEFSRFDVGLKLPVPCCGVELGEPLTKGRELVGGQALNLTFKISNPTHCAPLGILPRIVRLLSKLLTNELVSIVVLKSGEAARTLPPLIILSG
jgi:hypothetical protein